MRLKKITVGIAIIALIISLVPKSSLAIDTENISTYSPVAVLMEASTGKVLYEKSGYEKKYHASTTKLMTAILTLENCSLDEIATVSYDAVFDVPSGYTNANLQVGEELTIQQLLHLLLIPSANDAANVLAEHIAGSVESFATMMNTKAIELGCTGSNFTNPSGIHDKNHYSTAYDLALIGRYALQFSAIKQICMKTTYTLSKTNKYDKEDRYFVTTNSMIRESYTKYYSKYVTGLKTGYTDEAGDCIVATAKKNGVEYIVVILGAGYISNRTSREIFRL